MATQDNRTPKFRRKSESRRAKRSRTPSINDFQKDFESQPAQLSQEQIDSIEEQFIGLDDGRSRRTALVSLGRSGSELIAAVSSDKEAAIALACTVDPIANYAKRLRALADMMDSASTRIGLALCWREDMVEVVREAQEREAREAIPALPPVLRLVVNNTARP